MDAMLILSALFSRKLAALMTASGVDLPEMHASNKRTIY